MPLAPRLRNEPSASKRSSVSTAAGMKTKRARQKAMTAPTVKKETPTGKYPHLDWETVEAKVEWVTDVAGQITQAQMGANGYYSMSIYVPKSYAHAVLDAALAQEGSIMYIRLYHVPRRLFIDAMEDEIADEDNQEGGE